MPLFLDVKVPFDFSDTPTREQLKIIIKHLEAMSSELGEDSAIVTYLMNRHIPDYYIVDGGDDEYSLVEAVDAVKDDRREKRRASLKKRQTIRNILDVADSEISLNLPMQARVSIRQALKEL